MEKPTLPKGTRDFGPAQMAKRQFIFDNIKKVFQKYGFQPLETPAMENITTLTGKYGDEGDQLLFKVLDSGEYFEKFKAAQKVAEVLKGVDVSTYRVTQLEKTLYKILWKLSSLIKTNYPEAIVSYPWVDKIFEPLRNEILSKNKLLDNLTNGLLISEEDEKLLTSFFRQEYVYLPSIVVDTLKKTGSNYSEEIFSEKLAAEYGKAIMQILSEFNTTYTLNLNLELSLTQTTSKQLTQSITEKGLRYDLTVPFARYVVMNRGEMTFPFKRYQIQPVWRADRPQKGRYREFYQCDADVVGTDSLICEAEIILMIKEVFRALGILDYTIKINHRGVLAGLAELAGAKENQMSLFVAIDKLDKIGEAKVKEELIGKGFSESSLDTVFEILNFKGTTAEKVALLTSKFASSDNGNKGIKDLAETFDLLTRYGADHNHVELDIALARGLSYYTGCIFEVKINNVAIGSVSGGGRYDNLTGGFGLPNVSGVGISFGVDRLYDAMEELKVFPESTQASSKVLICYFDEESKRLGLKVVQVLRTNGIASEVYPDSVKINKQLDYANKKMIPYTIVIGSDEVKSGVLTLKDMRAGEQSKLLLEDILNKLTVDK